MKNYLKLASLIITVLIMNGSLFAQSKDVKKIEEQLKKAERALDELTSQDDNGIPLQLLEKMEGIVIMPRAFKVAFGVGGQGGHGFAMIKKEDGTWSNPFFLSMGEGSVGFQIGFQSTDIVLLFKYRENIEDLAKTEVTLGGDLGIAAGPVGRNSSANVDVGFDAEIYSYSRSKGLYAGISLEGTVLDKDVKVNDSFYEQEGISLQEIFYEKETPYTEGVAEVTALLNKASKK